MRAHSVASNLFAKEGWLKKLPPPLSGWTDHRHFPAFAKRSFRQAWAEREQAKGDES
jgi:L-lactate dehydrogenase complex protein LldF